MEIFLEGIGMLAVLVLFLVLLAVILRKRMAIIKWVDNSDAGTKAEDREKHILALNREREDIDRELKILEAKETPPEKP